LALSAGIQDEILEVLVDHVLARLRGSTEQLILISLCEVDDGLSMTVRASADDILVDVSFHAGVGCVCPWRRQTGRDSVA
jgi:hypothetical protein